MLSVEEAGGRILAAFARLSPTPVPVLEALGLVLAEDVVASFDIPPLANSAMDGYAVRVADTTGATADAPRRLRISANLAAGYVSETALQPGAAIRIMTGAPVPEGSEAVIQVELTEREADDVLVLAEATARRNIREAGEDVQTGQTVLTAGTRIRPAEVGVLASLGLAAAPCIRRPRVGILATGDELLEPGDPLAPGKIYNANAYSTAAQVQEAGGEPLLLGIARDTRESLNEKIEQAIEQGADLIVSSGGVSVGDFDLVKDMLAAQGEIDFWQVNMKPGKPLAFGHLGGVPMIGLPGNPVSSMISFELFGRPAIQKMLGQPVAGRRTVDACMEDAYQKTDDRRHYLRVQVREDAAGWRARLTGEQGSGILTSLTRANGIAIIPEAWESVQPGQEAPVWLLQ